MSSPQQSEPPSTVSHTDSPGPVQVVRVQPLALAGVLLFLFAVSFPVLGWPLGFGWMILLPVIAGYWVLRVRTTVTPEGLRTRGMVSSRTIAWSEVSGLRFPKRRWARAALRDGTEVVLHVVTIDDLPRIAAASGGHVPDPIPPAVHENDDEDAADSDTESVEDGADQARPS